MAHFCYFYHLTPTEYRRITIRDFSYMAEFMHEELSRQSQTNALPQ